MWCPYCQVIAPVRWLIALKAYRTLIADVELIQNCARGAGEAQAVELGPPLPLRTNLFSLSYNVLVMSSSLAAINVTL